MPTNEERIDQLERDLKCLSQSMTAAYGISRAWHEAMDAALPYLADTPGVATAMASQLKETRSAMETAGAPAAALSGFDMATALILSRFEALGLCHTGATRAH
ncbi:MAG: hypothetical protein M3N82_05450 [Pseudomonadota bacterium]|nr:hypothetical protein [Pseudomonadota bacterium]